LSIIKNLKSEKILWHVIGEGRNYNQLIKKKLENNLDNLKLYGLKKFDEIQSYFVNGFTQNSFSEYTLVAGGIYVDFYYLASKFFVPLDAVIFISPSP
jgi:hypothetical protein